jgi:hypothetical protein
MEFIMIKQGISLAVLAAALASVSATAADNSAGGVISFSGAVTDTTCTINGGKALTLPLRSAQFP